MSEKREVRVSRWYFGGLGSAGAACVTHPLDLLKVALQTHKGAKISIIQLTGKICRDQGPLTLYNGISASLMRQLTYSTARFGIYEVGKDVVGNNPSFVNKILLAGVSGAVGGFIGAPSDLVNVRMQNDVKLALSERRNYKHAIDGLYRVYSEEGFRRLFSGASTAVSRGFLMTVGQIAFYDQIKSSLLDTKYFDDNVQTHFLSSLLAGAIATALTQPLDVLKTRIMNAQPGEFASVWSCVQDTARSGPMGFFRGFVPAFVRLGPQTILTFLLLEQLRLNFGHKKIV